MNDDLEARFWARLEVNDCWEWTGAITSRGYGSIRVDGKAVSTHVLAWTLLVGPVDLGLEIDHRCRNRRCCNPDHLEPVTHRENMRRSPVGWHLRQKSDCPQGHPYTPENTLVNAAGSRVCRLCSRAKWHRWNQRRQQKIKEVA